MVDNRPLVSIGMPVYNGEKFLRRTLDSLLAQDYENFELIISDNASEDETQAICLEYAGTDHRIRCHRNASNLGMRWNFNRVFQLSRGEYFMWAGDHDLWDKTFISTCLDALTSNPNVALCYGETVGIGGQGESERRLECWIDTRGLPPAERFRRVIRDMEWYTPIYGLIRADALRKTRLSRNTRGPDIVLLCELSLMGEFHFVPKVLFWYNFFPDEERRRRTVREWLLVYDPANRGRLLITRFPTCTMVCHLLSVVKNSNLRLAVKAKLWHDVIRICSARWRDPIASEMGVRWLLQAIRFGRRLLRQANPYPRAT